MGPDPRAPARTRGADSRSTSTWGSYTGNAATCGQVTGGGNRA
ncbi:hypothetical protein SLI_1724 [Streptomyces lividans 1326]|uniref:Uncharacterized protein n=1 Tax=Streptomyces lividans 1326 TaxID=1200984 RepID=A0A7U9DM13_STRLI|nr:hypothetical protein SLI_1724 [Streptomyces lividans 1326]